jgi:hypothetical protein
MTGTMRQRMEQHRTNPQCAACHARMDPIGFSLENYDAIGAWRTKDANNEAIDVSGQLPDGTTFNGPEAQEYYHVAKGQVCANLDIQDAHLRPGPRLGRSADQLHRGWD